MLPAAGICTLSIVDDIAPISKTAVSQQQLHAEPRFGAYRPQRRRRHTLTPTAADHVVPDDVITGHRHPTQDRHFAFQFLAVKDAASVSCFRDVTVSASGVHARQIIDLLYSITALYATAVKKQFKSRKTYGTVMILFVRSGGMAVRHGGA